MVAVELWVCGLYIACEKFTLAESLTVISNVTQVSLLLMPELFDNPDCPKVVVLRNVTSPTKANANRERITFHHLDEAPSRCLSVPFMRSRPGANGLRSREKHLMHFRCT